MPYDKRQEGENWVVFNTETNEDKATHEPPDAEEKADRQLRLLRQMEAGEDA